MVRELNVSGLVVAILVLLDGFFHLTGSLETFMKFGPDWIIKGFVYGTDGFGVGAHKLIGVTLFFVGGFMLWFQFQDSPREEQKMM